MYTFTCNDDSFTLAKEDIPQNSLLSDLINIYPNNDNIELENITKDEFSILKDYFVNDTIPTIEQYYIFEYMRIDCNSYNLALVIENDMRVNMYSEDNTKYQDMYYGLIKLDNEFWDKLKIPIQDGDDILTYNKELVKSPYYSILSNLSIFDRILSIDNVFLAGGAIFSVLFGLPINDLDLFIYGCSEEEATNKIREISKILDYTTVIRTRTSVSFSVKDSTVNEVQVILRLYKTKSEILLGCFVRSIRCVLCCKATHTTWF